MNAWAKRELIRPEDAGIPGRALVPWFVYLHAQCYKGTDFPEHDELESEVLSQLAIDLKERSLEGTLQKFCVVNIAAEDFARKRSNGKFPDVAYAKKHSLISNCRGVCVQCLSLLPANQCEDFFHFTPDSFGRTGAICGR